MGLCSSCFDDVADTRVRVAIPELRKLVTKFLLKEIPRKFYNYPDKLSDVDICTDVLMYAELRGNNQGVVKLISHSLRAHPEATSILVGHETSISAKVNGGQRIGMAVVSRLSDFDSVPTFFLITYTFLLSSFDIRGVDVAIQKAKLNNIGLVACSNYSSATGAIGYWARTIAEAGLIGIVMSQCNELMAPYGSYEPIFGTNPIAFGVPTGTGENIVFDMATSAEAYFGILLASLANTPIRADVAYDSQGNETTDANMALTGALRVFDRSHKGSGLAVMVELLAGALTGAAVENKDASANWGSLVIAINPNIFGDAELFLRNASILCKRVRSAKRLDENKPIYLPGERGDALERKNLARGTINISRSLYEQLFEYTRSISWEEPLITSNP